MKSIITTATFAVLLATPLQAQVTTVPGTVDPNTGMVVQQQPMQPVPMMPVPEDPQVEIVFWESIKDEENPTLFLAYLQRYPNGVFRVIAEEKLKELYAGGGDDEEEAEEDDKPTTQIITVQPTAPSRGDSVAAAVQRELRRLGCYRGPIDGIWGPGSSNAARLFNRNYSGRNIAVNNANRTQLSRLRGISGRVCR